MRRIGVLGWLIMPSVIVTCAALIGLLAFQQWTAAILSVPSAVASIVALWWALPREDE